MADASKDGGMEAFRATLGRLLRVSKSEVLKKERAYKEKRRSARSRVAPRRKAG